MRNKKNQNYIIEFCTRKNYKGRQLDKYKAILKQINQQKNENTR